MSDILGSSRTIIQEQQRTTSSSTANTTITLNNNNVYDTLSYAYHLFNCDLYNYPFLFCTELISEFFNLLYFRRIRAFIFQLCLIFLLFTYFFMILVSGGIFLAIVVIPFVGYKLYKKFAGKCGSHVPNSLFFCCRTRNRNHENYGNFLRKRIVPRVELDFPANLRVGQTISLRVIVSRSCWYNNQQLAVLIIYIV